MRTASIVLLIAALFSISLFAQEAGHDFAQGEDLFMQDKPEEALPFLERAFAANPSIEAALYLAMCYEQLDKLDEAAAVYRGLLPQGGDKTALIACNLGNIYFRMGNGVLAEQFYTQAVRADPSYAPAFLNRANTRIRNNALRDALPDYERYLGLEPASPQRPQIERLIGLIQETFAAEAIRRLMVEESSRSETERRQRLLDEAIAAIAIERLQMPFPADEPAAVAKEEIVEEETEEEAVEAEGTKEDAGIETENKIETDIETETEEEQ